MNEVSFTLLSALPAYIGPGGAVSALGAVVAAIVGVFIAIVGFLWYPIRRLLRKRRQSQADSGAQPPTE